MPILCFGALRLHFCYVSIQPSSMASTLQAHNMNANHTERSRQQSQRVPKTEHPPHPPFVQPGLRWEIICMVVPIETSRHVETEHRGNLHKLKRHRKAPGSDLRRTFMANKPNNEPLEQLFESILFAGHRKQNSKQGQTATPMGEPQPKRQGGQQPRERSLLPTSTSASQRVPRRIQHARRPTSNRGPRFQQRVENSMPGERGERSHSAPGHTCNTRHDKDLYWNKHRIQQHAGLGNQVDRQSKCNKAQQEALFPPPPEVHSMNSSWTSFWEDEEARRSETRIPIGCRVCEKFRQQRKTNEVLLRELAEREQSLGNVHTPCSNLGRSAKASVKGLWSILRHRSGWYRRFNSTLKGLHGDAQPLLLGKFQNGNQPGLMAGRRD